MELDSLQDLENHFSFRSGFPEMFLAPTLEWGLLKHKVTMFNVYRPLYICEPKMRQGIVDITLFLTVLKLETA